MSHPKKSHKHSLREKGGILATNGNSWLCCEWGVAKQIDNKSQKYRKHPNYQPRIPHNEFLNKCPYLWHLLPRFLPYTHPLISQCQWKLLIKVAMIQSHRISNVNHKLPAIANPFLFSRCGCFIKSELPNEHFIWLRSSATFCTKWSKHS